LTFREFNFHKELLKGIRIAGFREPSPIQARVIPLIQNGEDLVAQAHTGTGKTAGFGLPIINKIVNGGIDRALIITPTRELATQISDELYHLGRFTGIRTIAVYGGVGYGRQIALINKGVQIVVATPGRLKDLYKKGKIDKFNPEIVVLDEADEILDMGFLDDIKEIFEYIPQNRQTLLFSATIPDPIKALADEILSTPKFISIVGDDRSATNNIIQQQYYVINESQRDSAIVKLLEMEKIKKCIIFCRMKREVDRLSEHLQALGFNARGIHGDLEQQERDEVIKAYRRNEIQIMVATDVASRGLDVREISHVFNYHIPFDPQSYVHRIGRTGRAGRKGKAITLVSTDEFRELKRIQKEVGAEMNLATIRVESDEISTDFTQLERMVRETPIDDLAIDFIDSMEDMDYHEFVERVVTLLLKANSSTTTQIGYDEESVNSMIEEYDDEQKVARRGNRSKKQG
jgi:ATP-dependent RNA helicase DeaD